jgi:hypothetical protein
MWTIWECRVPRCLARLFGSMPKLALVGRPDAGRGDEMSPVIASSQLARKDK